MQLDDIQKLNKLKTLIENNKHWFLRKNGDYETIDNSLRIHIGVNYDSWLDFYGTTRIAWNNSEITISSPNFSDLDFNEILKEIKSILTNLKEQHEKNDRKSK